MTIHLDVAVKALVAVADEKQGQGIRAFKINDESCIADYIIVVGAKNQIHCRSIIEDYQDQLSPLLKKWRSDDFYEKGQVIGSSDSGWVILDLNSVIIHCIVSDLRQFYDLDGLFETRGTVFYFD